MHAYISLRSAAPHATFVHSPREDKIRRSRCALPHPPLPLRISFLSLLGCLDIDTLTRFNDDDTSVIRECSFCHATRFSLQIYKRGSATSLFRYL